jgi:RNA polymerase sigma-70 factor (ECF subfamily)
MTENECHSVFAMLSEYLERELPPGTCEELDRHIQGCAPCVEFVESLRKSVALGQTYAPRVEPPGMPAALRETLREAYLKSLAVREKQAAE